MVLLAHYDLELHQMDVKTTFLNGDLYENVYIVQPKRFCRGRKEHMGCRLQKSIYGLKVSLQTVVFKVDKNNKKDWVLKKMRRTIVFMRSSRMKNSFSTSYEDDILLTSSDVNLSLEKKKFCPQVSMRMILVKCHWFQESKFTKIEENGVLGLSQMHTQKRF